MHTPWYSTDIAKKAALTEGAAAKQTKELKKANMPKIVPGGMTPDSIPFALEQFVDGDQKPTNFPFSWPERSRDEEGKMNSVEFKTY